MWMLGSGGTSGSDATQEENTNNENTSAIPGPQCSTDEDDENDDDDDVHLIKSRSPPRYMSQSSPPPGVVRVSEAEIDGSSSEEEESPALSSNAADGIPSTVAEMAALSLSESTQGTINSSSPKSRSAGSLNQRLHPSSRKLSWSDRAGGDLATYSAYDAVRQRLNPDLSAKPIKSSMKKSNGLAAFVRGGGAPTAPAPSSDAGPAGDGDGTKGKSKYIPSGIVGGKGRGMIMPSGGGICMPSYYPPNSTIIAARDSNSAACSAAAGSSSHSGPAGSTASKGPLPGNFSPQWGWYISTTPPTPEKYYAAPHTGKKPTKTSEKKLDNVPETKPAEHPAPVFHHSKPSPVFKKGGVPSATMGWPTVPL